MDERVREIVGDEEAWIVGGAVRDLLLDRPVLDLDVACRDPKDAARRYARRFGGAAFPLSERHGAWRVVVDGDEQTVDFTPLPGTIEDDLGTRDFTFNAIAIPVGGGDPRDPHGGQADLEAGVVRAVSGSVFEDDPLRLLRAVRLEDELGFTMDSTTEELLRRSAALVTYPAGERILVELRRLSPAGYRRLDALGLLAKLGGVVDDRVEAVDDPGLRLQFDTYQFGRVVPDVSAIFGDLAPLVGHIQVGDVPDRHEPGTGAIDWDAFFRSVVEAGYDRAIGLEYVPARGTLEGLDWVERYGLVRRASSVTAARSEPSSPTLPGNTTRTTPG